MSPPPSCWVVPAALKNKLPDWCWVNFREAVFYELRSGCKRIRGCRVLAWRCRRGSPVYSILSPTKGSSPSPPLSRSILSPLSGSHFAMPHPRGDQNDFGPELVVLGYRAWLFLTPPPAAQHDVCKSSILNLSLCSGCPSKKKCSTLKIHTPWWWGLYMYITKGDKLHWCI